MRISVFVEKKVRIRILRIIKMLNHEGFANIREHKRTLLGITPENIFLSVCKAGRNVKPPLTH